jgi:hypothetical protein
MIKRNLKINQYARELIGNGDLLGTLGIEIPNSVSSPLYKLDHHKK